MESLCRGTSGMDAARGVKGHGWLFYAGPRSSDGAREPRRSRGRMQGQAFLVTFFATGKSDLAQQGETRTIKQLANRNESKAFIQERSDFHPSRKTTRLTRNSRTGTITRSCAITHSTMVNPRYNG